MGPTWRYIPPLEADGATQMAVDEWLLNQHLAGKIPSVLRFYTWQPVAISLGYNQRKYPQTWHDLTYQGAKIELVRRPSGGRAVLHQGELTYALITSGMAGDRCQVYKELCEFLIQGWQTLGISLNYGDQKCNYNHHASCFHTYTRADLVTPEGYKLIGSAQLRRKQAILQHGSIRLHPDPQLYTQIFGEELIVPVHLQFSQLDVINSLRQSFGDRQQIILQENPLNDNEWQQINTLKSSRKHPTLKP